MSSSNSCVTRLRSLPSYHLTRKLGDIFRASACTGSVSDYEKSKDCDTIDDFVSHAWALTWWRKGISLCYVYNHACALRTATVTLFLLLGLGHLMHGLGFMHDEAILMTVTWVPVLVQCAVLFFGQEFLPHLRRSTFLDKACICQDDEVKKQEGIRNLDAYLRGSKRFVMLWNEDYFKSLWCVWEAAMFLKDSKGDKTKSMEITPIFLMILTVLGIIAACGFVILGDVLRVVGVLEVMLEAYSENPNCFDVYTCLFLSSSFFLATTFFNIFLSQFVEGMAAIEGQLMSFRWRHARCHLEADRQRLGRQVSELHGSIEAFEEILHTAFLEDCKTHLGGSLFPYRNILTICFPVLCSGLARLCLVDDLSSAIFVGLSYSLIYFVGCPLHIWSAKRYWQLLVPRLGSSTLQRHRLGLSMLVAIPFTIQGIPVVFFGLRILSFAAVKAADPTFDRPDTLTPLLSWT